MNFITDRQTLNDLNIPGKYAQDSISSLFMHTVTRGGERLMDSMFRSPLCDPAKINARSAIFTFFASQGVRFPFDGKQFDAIDRYLSNSGRSSMLTSYMNTLRSKAMQLIAFDKEYHIVEENFMATISMLNSLRGFVAELTAADSNGVIMERLEEIRNILELRKLSWISSKNSTERPSVTQLMRYDHILRAVCRTEMKRILEFLYELDIYACVGHIASERGFSQAVALERGTCVLDVRGVFHPQLPGAVGNDIRIDKQKNVFFLTGANMAGKSTFMKSVGVAVYLAHMGFPVAAQTMEFSVLDGMFSSINVSDNLNLGYSHFYAEVLRVKDVARAVAASRNLLVIFDELFKGTNVKDAYDATVAVTEALSRHHNCSFIISTHITEAGVTLGRRCSNLQFHYMPTVMEGSRPVYTYKLTGGITVDRHGMMIINNERVVEIIENTHRK